MIGVLQQAEERYKEKKVSISTFLFSKEKIFCDLKLLTLRKERNYMYPRNCVRQGIWRKRHRRMKQQGIFSYKTERMR